MPLLVTGEDARMFWRLPVSTWSSDAKRRSPVQSCNLSLLVKVGPVVKMRCFVRPIATVSHSRLHGRFPWRERLSARRWIDRNRTLQLGTVSFLGWMEKLGGVFRTMRGRISFEVSRLLGRFSVCFLSAWRRQRPRGLLKCCRRVKFLKLPCSYIIQSK